MPQERQPAARPNSRKRKKSQEVSGPSMTLRTAHRKPSPQTTRSRKRPGEYERKKQELLEVATELLQQEPDEFDLVGYSVACQLRTLTVDQRIQYQRILSDLNTEGQLGLLNVRSYLGNHDRPVPPPEAFPMDQMPGYDFQASMLPSP